MMPSPQALSMGGMEQSARVDVKAAPACGDGGGQAGGAAADHEYVGGTRERHAVKR